MRLPVLGPEEMNPRQQELSARITERRGGVRGPFRVWLQSPELCERVESLGAFVRFESSLPKHLRELTLLMAARHWDAQYSWNAHVNTAIEAGIPEAAVEAIAERREPVFPDEVDQAFYAFCHELLELHFVTDETFAAALKHFGSQGLVDAVGSLGNFSMLGMCLNAFQVDLQPGRKPPFPDIRGYARVAADGKP
ncbi:carboxymuconolactone decarboxylase family protein [Streptomyces sp. NBC_01262]|uniref:carboxymuconolactone decarboxylase family protein n=1 Tax=Streptomyces sp. NBC_01262 TaxID=2903803 RepID=UPI002E316155|nr:carboxymuconolactone decarboxylase family protein [Streptomyces sp. NBC_01262]